MKTFKEYLAESKKVYSVKVKVAGELPEGFADDLKARLEGRQIVSFEAMGSTPVTETPLDFPQMSNCEVHTFEVITDYPITPTEVEKEVFEMGLATGTYVARNSGAPSEEYQATDAEREGSLLQDNEYKEGINVKHKDYFGDDFNKAFLKELSKEAKARSKELGHDKAKPNVYDNATAKPDKAGIASPVGSK